MSGFATPPISQQAIAHVLLNLWPRGHEELRRLGSSQEAAFWRFWDYAHRGRSHSLEFDGVPVAIAGIATEGGESFTWFQATTDFEKHVAPITKFLRQSTGEHKGPLFIYSVCVHPETARWFRALRFLPDGHEETLPTGAILRRFKRR